MSSTDLFKYLAPEMWQTNLSEAKEEPATKTGVFDADSSTAVWISIKMNGTPVHTHLLKTVFSKDVTLFSA